MFALQGAAGAPEVRAAMSWAEAAARRRPAAPANNRASCARRAWRLLKSVALFLGRRFVVIRSISVVVDVSVVVVVVVVAERGDF